MPPRRPPAQPGELSLGEAAASGLVPVGKERLRQLAKHGDVPSRKVAGGPQTTYYFFRRESLQAYFAGRPTRSRKREGLDARIQGEIQYLRGQIATLESRRDELQDELTKAQVRWATAEARIDELKRKCSEQKATIESLTAAIRRLSRPLRQLLIVSSV